jgi:class 3 adenylate cyclase/HAMP domain-containing protein
MSIRYRILLIVLPLIISSLVIAQVITSLSARNGLTEVATEFLRFKSDQLNVYGENQWEILVQNGLSQESDFVEASHQAVASYAESLVRSDSEVIFALDADGDIAMTTEELPLTDLEAATLADLTEQEARGWVEFSVGGENRVGWARALEPFGWLTLVTEKQATFFSAVNQMYLQTGIVIAVAALVSVALLLLFTHYLTSPLRNVVSAMREIISTNELSRRVEVLYDDETGELGHSFNVMTSGLEKAYAQIKEYALKAGIARHKERRIRNIFQKYVPSDVIDQFFTSPESMLVGQDRELAVLFSDIRSFTTISEGMEPNELVEALNRYFDGMVNVIMNRNGIVDKYIGDAIMAFYGAPVKREDDALQATLSALDMVERLKVFNQEQRSLGLPEFNTGIGISYGLVTVGNIGTQRKMDYTVIGDMVNLASRLEGLTKVYNQPILISDSVRNEVAATVPCRLVDQVVVKGKSRAVGIYAPQRQLSETEQRAWELYQQGLNLYYSRSFQRSWELLSEAEAHMPGDPLCQIYLDRARDLIENPPTDEWTGYTVMTTK